MLTLTIFKINVEAKIFPKNKWIATPKPKAIKPAKTILITCFTNALYPREILFLIKNANNVAFIVVIKTVDSAIPFIPKNLTKIELKINFRAIDDIAIIKGVLESLKE